MIGRSNMYFREWEENCTHGSPLHTSLTEHCQNRIGTKFFIEEVAEVSFREINDEVIKAESQIPIAGDQYRTPYPSLGFSVGSVSFYYTVYTVNGASELFSLHSAQLKKGESLSSTFMAYMTSLRPDQRVDLVMAIIVRSQCIPSFDSKEVMSQHLVEVVATIEKLEIW